MTWIGKKLIKLLTSCSENFHFITLKPLSHCFFLDFKWKSWTKLEKSKKTIIRISWKKEIRKFKKSHDELFQYFTFCKWASPKMLQNIKHACFMIFCILGDAHLQNLSFLWELSTEFIFFNFSDIATYPRKLRNQN